VPSFAVILAAAGKSSRFRDAHYKKPFIALEGRAVWLHSAEKFLNRKDVAQVIVVISPEDREDFFSKFGPNVAILGIDVVDGGAERRDSVQAALAKVRKEVDFVAVHDAARPCLADEWIDNVFAAAQKSGAAILAAPVTGTLKKVSPQHQIEATVPRDQLWEAQTPQVFRREWLAAAYEQKSPATDDAQLIEQLGHKVTVVPCSAMNLKITTKDDLRLAAQILKALPKPKALVPNHPFENDDMWR
jgi:2-C-methyl-D-erythritol 4-phosphate cytidylyltransferase